MAEVFLRAFMALFFPEAVDTPYADAIRDYQVAEAQRTAVLPELQDRQRSFCRYDGSYLRPNPVLSGVTHEQYLRWMGHDKIQQIVRSLSLSPSGDDAFHQASGVLQDTHLRCYCVAYGYAEGLEGAGGDPSKFDDWKALEGSAKTDRLRADFGSHAGSCLSKSEQVGYRLAWQSASRFQEAYPALLDRFMRSRVTYEPLEDVRSCPAVLEVGEKATLSERRVAYRALKSCGLELSPWERALRDSLKAHGKTADARKVTSLPANVNASRGASGYDMGSIRHLPDAWNHINLRSTAYFTPSFMSQAWVRDRNYPTRYPNEPGAVVHDDGAGKSRPFDRPPGAVRGFFRSLRSLPYMYRLWIAGGDLRRSYRAAGASFHKDAAESTAGVFSPSRATQSNSSIFAFSEKSFYERLLSAFASFDYSWTISTLPTRFPLSSSRCHDDDSCSKYDHFFGMRNSEVPSDGYDEKIYSYFDPARRVCDHELGNPAVLYNDSGSLTQSHYSRYRHLAVTSYDRRHLVSSSDLSGLRRNCAVRGIFTGYPVIFPVRGGTGVNALLPGARMVRSSSDKFCYPGIWSQYRWWIMPSIGRSDSVLPPDSPVRSSRRLPDPWGWPGYEAIRSGSFSSSAEGRAYRDRYGGDFSGVISPYGALDASDPYCVDRLGLDVYRSGDAPDRRLFEPDLTDFSFGGRQYIHSSSFSYFSDGWGSLSHRSSVLGIGDSYCSLVFFNADHLGTNPFGFDARSCFHPSDAGGAHDVKLRTDGVPSSDAAIWLHPSDRNSILSAPDWSAVDGTASDCLLGYAAPSLRVRAPVGVERWNPYRKDGGFRSEWFCAASVLKHRNHNFPRERLPEIHNGSRRPLEVQFIQKRFLELYAVRHWNLRAATNWFQGKTDSYDPGDPYLARKVSVGSGVSDLEKDLLVVPDKDALRADGSKVGVRPSFAGFGGKVLSHRDVRNWVEALNFFQGYYQSPYRPAWKPGRNPFHSRAEPLPPELACGRHYRGRPESAGEWQGYLSGSTGKDRVDSLKEDGLGGAHEGSAKIPNAYDDCEVFETVDYHDEVCWLPVKSRSGVDYYGARHWKPRRKGDKQIGTAGASEENFCGQGEPSHRYRFTRVFPFAWFRGQDLLEHPAQGRLHSGDTRPWEANSPVAWRDSPRGYWMLSMRHQREYVQTWFGLHGVGIRTFGKVHMGGVEPICFNPDVRDFEGEFFPSGGRGTGDSLGDSDRTVCSKMPGLSQERADAFLQRHKVPSRLRFLESNSLLPGSPWQVALAKYSTAVLPFLGSDRALLEPAPWSGSIRIQDPYSPVLPDRWFREKGSLDGGAHSGFELPIQILAKVQLINQYLSVPLDLSRGTWMIEPVVECTDWNHNRTLCEAYRPHPSYVMTYKNLKAYKDRGKALKKVQKGVGPRRSSDEVWVLDQRFGWYYSEDTRLFYKMSEIQTLEDFLLPVQWFNTYYRDPFMQREKALNMFAVPSPGLAAHHPQSGHGVSWPTSGGTWRSHPDRANIRSNLVIAPQDRGVVDPHDGVYVDPSEDDLKKFDFNVKPFHYRDQIDTLYPSAGSGLDPGREETVGRCWSKTQACRDARIAWNAPARSVSFAYLREWYKRRQRFHQGFLYKVLSIESLEASEDSFLFDGSHESDPLLSLYWSRFGIQPGFSSFDYSNAAVYRRYLRSPGQIFDHRLARPDLVMGRNFTPSGPNFRFPGSASLPRNRFEGATAEQNLLFAPLLWHQRPAWQRRIASELTLYETGCLDRQPLVDEKASVPEDGSSEVDFWIAKLFYRDRLTGGEKSPDGDPIPFGVANPVHRPMIPVTYEDRPGAKSHPWSCLTGSIGIRAYLWERNPD